MSTRYDAVTIDYGIEFGVASSSTVELTDAAREDPRWKGFLELFHELREAQVRVEMIASGPGNITLL